MSCYYTTLGDINQQKTPWVKKVVASAAPFDFTSFQPGLCLVLGWPYTQGAFGWDLLSAYICGTLYY